MKPMVRRVLFCVCMFGCFCVSLHALHTCCWLFLLLLCCVCALRCSSCSFILLLAVIFFASSCVYVVSDSFFCVFFSSFVSMCTHIYTTTTPTDTEPFRPLIPTILTSFFHMLDAVGIQRVVTTLETFVDRFESDMAPYAVQLTTNLVLGPCVCESRCACVYVYEGTRREEREEGLCVHQSICVIVYRRASIYIHTSQNKKACPMMRLYGVFEKCTYIYLCIYETGPRVDA